VLSVSAGDLDSNAVGPHIETLVSAE
jgi:hypothetical protein